MTATRSPLLSSLSDQQDDDDASARRRSCVPMRRGCCVGTLGLVALVGLVSSAVAESKDLPAPMAWEAGPFSTTEDTIDVGGFEHKHSWLNKQTALAYYPSGAAAAGRKFPLLSFSHGDIAGYPLTNYVYGDLLHKVASHGFVILAHESCVPTCDNDQWLDQVHALAWADTRHRDGTASTHPVLRLVDFSKPKGVFGQSTGGRSSIQSAANASGPVGTKDSKKALGTCIGAAVGLNPDPCIGYHPGYRWKHGGCDSARKVSGVALAIFSGTADSIEAPGSAEANFVAAPTTDKIYANMTGAGHMDGCSPLWGGFTAAFFQVHLNGQGVGTPYYNRVYGRGRDSLCGGHYPMAHCRTPEPTIHAGPAACAAALGASAPH